MVRGLQAVAVVLTVIGVLGLWWAGEEVTRGKVPIVNVLRTIQADLEAHAARIDSRVDLPAHFPKRAQDLLNSMAAIRINEIRSIFVPTSWYGGLERDIVDCMYRAYRKIIMIGIRTALESRADELTEYQDKSAGPDARVLFGKDSDLKKQQEPTANLVQTPEFIALNNYVQGLAELEVNIDLFNEMARAGEHDLSSLARIVNYLYGVELSGKFYAQARYYQETLARIPLKPIFIQGYRKSANTKAANLIKRFYQVAFHDNPLVGGLKKLAAELDSLGNVQSCQTGDCLVWGLLENIQRIDKALHGADLVQIMKSPPQLWASVQTVLDTMRNSKFFGPRVADEAEKTAKSQLIVLRNEWLEIEKQYTGQLIKSKNADEKACFSTYVEAIKQGLIDLWQQDFTGADLIEAPPIIIPPSARFRWNTNLLNEASALVLSYDKYRTGGYGKFPRGLRASMDNVARDCLEKNALKFVARASDTASPQFGYGNHIPESVALDEARNFQDASKSLSFLLDSFNRLKLDTGYRVLSDLVYWQTSSLLGILDGILESEGLYELDTADRRRWESEANLALAAFDVTDDKELEYYLNLQRQRIDYLAGYAGSMVYFYSQSLMNQAARDGTLFFKWGRIQTDLKDYKANKPNNNVTELEKFIRFQVGKTNLQNFYRMIPPTDLQAHSSDYFLEKRNDIRRALYRECRSLASGKLNDKYETIKDFFNNCLAGRFPFSDGRSDDGIEAAPADIKQFYRLYDMYAEDIRNVLTPETKNSAIDFLDQMGRARPVFASFLDPPPGKKKAPEKKKDDKDDKDAKKGNEDKKKEKKPGKPVLDFMLEFRVNRAMEENANKIMEWALTVGQYEYIDDGSVLSGIWEYTDPAAVILRFAKDSGYRPDPDSVSGAVKVSGKTIIYNFPGQWALLGLIGSHAADPRDFVKHVDPNPYTLKFCIDTISEDAATGKSEKLPTKVFIRLTPMDAAKKPITVPCFPVKAPPWN